MFICNTCYKEYSDEIKYNKHVNKKCIKKQNNNFETIIKINDIEIKLYNNDCLIKLEEFNVYYI